MKEKWLGLLSIILGLISIIMIIQLNISIAQHFKLIKNAPNVDAYTVSASQPKTTILILSLIGVVLAAFQIRLNIKLGIVALLISTIALILNFIPFYL